MGGGSKAAVPPGVHHHPFLSKSIDDAEAQRTVIIRDASCARYLQKSRENLIPWIDRRSRFRLLLGCTGLLPGGRRHRRIPCVESGEMRLRDDVAGQRAA